METYDIIRRLMQGEFSPNEALQELTTKEDQIDPLADRMAEQIEVIRVATRFVNRYLCLNRSSRSGLPLSEQDFLMTLRDAVLRLGNFPVPADIRTMVERQGAPFHLSVTPLGEVTADVGTVNEFPSLHFVRQCYGKEKYYIKQSALTAGDHILYQTTGYPRYKSYEQKIAVHTAITLPPGYTMLVTLPTGEGKSLITQILAAMNPGLTVLVVPTTALGKDQTRTARTTLRHSVAPEKIVDICGLQPGQSTDIVRGITNRDIRLLITSPEALIKNQMLKSALSEAAANGYFQHLVIDEAHIIQDWGAHFRPDFQFLSVLRRSFLRCGNHQLRTVLLSATMTDTAVDLLKTMFSEEDGSNSNWIPLRCDALRTEIRYMVDPVTTVAEHRANVLRYVHLLPKPMLIYTIKPDVAQEWFDFLQSNGLHNIRLFTGLTEDNERAEIIEKWSGDQLDAVVATSAFGMGIDKANVRSVIHVTMPENMNRFYQEVGRGGRDGLPSLSLLCYNPTYDLNQQDAINHRKLMRGENLLARWEKMAQNSPEELQANRILLNPQLAPKYFDDVARTRTGIRNRDWNLHTILFLVRNGFLRFEDLQYDATQQNYLIRVSMIDPELMQDYNRLGTQIEDKRDIEYSSSETEFEEFQRMIEQRCEKCFSESFTEIYPKAAQDCGGCEEHKEERFDEDSNYRLHQEILPYPCSYSFSAGELQVDQDLWGFNHMLLIDSKAPDDMSRSVRIASRVNKSGVTTWIQNAFLYGQNLSSEFDGLVLNREEASVLLKKDPSLLGSGLLFTMGPNPGENQRLLEMALDLFRQNANVALNMDRATIVRSANRTIEHLVQCRILTEPEILRE